MRISFNELRVAKKLCLAVLFVALILSLCACVDGNASPLTAEMEATIKQDFYDAFMKHSNQTVDDVQIKTVYGIFDDCVVLTIDGKNSVYPNEESSITVDGIKFVFSNKGKVIRVWHVGSFYGLNAAFAHKILTQENVAEIAQLYGNTELNPNPDLESKIKQDYFNAHLLYESASNATTNDVIIWGNLGTYNGSVALIINDRLSDGLTVEVKETVAGIEFIYADTASTISIWHDGSFCSLTSAYSQGFLTQENVAEIAEFYRELQ